MTVSTAGLQLQNGTVELRVSTAFGPRILHYGFAGERNVFGELPDAAVSTAWGEWKPWGGHRLWIAPEHMPGSYTLDRDPVDVEHVSARHLLLRQPVDPRVGMEKQLEILLDAHGTGVTVHHRIVNRTIWHIEAAPWGITIMPPGGEAVLPQEPFRSHAEAPLPARAMVLWPYTDLTDRRFRISSRLIRLRVDESMQEPQKIGISNRVGWAAYCGSDWAFIKRADYQEGARYPDFGCSAEVFTQGGMLELETLAPLRDIAPDQAATHTECWELRRLDPKRAADDAALLQMIAP